MTTAMAPTPAQSEASRLNGARSKGPTSAVGKMVSAMNAIKAGVTAELVLMPGEDLADHQAMADAMTQTLRTATAGEAILGVRLADGVKRLDRLDRQEQRVREDGVEQAILASDAHRRMLRLAEARQVAADMAFTVGGIQQAVAAEWVRQLAPAMRQVMVTLEAVGVPLALLVPLQRAVEGVLRHGGLEVEAAAFSAIALPTTDVVAWLDTAVVIASVEVGKTRTELATDPTVGNERKLRLIDLYRKRVLGEMERVLRVLAQLRALPATDTTAGSFVRVELRVAGRPNLAQL